MNARNTWLTAGILFILLLSACDSAATPAATEPPAQPTSTRVEPSATPLPPTDTPIPPTDTPEPTLEPTEPSTATPEPTSAAPARPTLVPGTTFEFASSGLGFEFKVPECNMREVMYGKFTTEGIAFDVPGKMAFVSGGVFGPDSPQVFPSPGDDVLCWVDGEVKSGTATDALVQSWLDDETVFLIDPDGVKSRLVFAGLDAGEQDVLLLFSAKRGYVPSQLQMPDVLVDLP